MSSDHTMTRRRALAVTAGAAAAAAMPERASALAARAGAARTAGGFLSPHELTLLDEIAELIIPADAQSGGARTAKCAQYIDARLAESIDPDWRQSWKDDLAEIDETSVAMFGRPLLQASRIERQKLMERISRNEKSPKENVEHSFVTIKWWVAEAYYTSEIGIHDELKYRGNVFIDEFIGTDVSKSAVEPKTPTK
jgi:glucoside 3-dehydrogenase (cytochrome c) hitch-hiker subunit